MITHPDAVAVTGPIARTLISRLAVLSAFAAASRRSDNTAMRSPKKRHSASSSSINPRHTAGTG